MNSVRIDLAAFKKKSNALMALGGTLQWGRLVSNRNGPEATRPNARLRSMS